MSPGRHAWLLPKAIEHPTSRDDEKKTCEASTRDCSRHVRLSPSQGEVARGGKLAEARNDKGQRNCGQDARAPLRAAASGSRNRGIEFCAGVSGDQSLTYSRVMKMTNRDRQRVRRIMRLRHSAQRQQHPYHLLNLLSTVPEPHDAAD